MDPDESINEVYDAETSVDNVAGLVAAGGNTNAGLDSTRSDHAMTERDDELAEQTMSGAKSMTKRKGGKGINHFSFCDRATQTTVPPVRVKSRRFSLTELKNSTNDIFI